MVNSLFVEWDKKKKMEKLVESRVETVSENKFLFFIFIFLRKEKVYLK